MTDFMGELRSALHDPTDDTFTQVIDLLVAWPDKTQMREVALPYAHDMIQRWPKSLRRPMPQAWSDVFYADKEQDARVIIESSCLVSNLEPHSWWTWGKKPGGGWKIPSPERGSSLALLATSIGIHNYTAEDRIEWLTNSEAPRLTSLAINAGGLSARAGELLNKSLWLDDRIESLRITLNEEALLAMCDGLSLKNVHRLDLSGGEGVMTPASVEAILDVVRGSPLVELDCSSAWLSYEAAEIISKHPALEQVTHLDMRYNAYIGGEGVEALQTSPILTEEARAGLDDMYEDIFE